MSYNIDNIIFIGFLAANLLVGLFYSRNVKDIREYAIGKQNFSSIARQLLRQLGLAGEFYHKQLQKHTNKVFILLSLYLEIRWYY